MNFALNKENDRMLFWLFVVILVIGLEFFFWYDQIYKKYCSVAEMVNGIMTGIGAICFVSSLAIMGFCYINSNGQADEFTQRYESLTYQYENVVFDSESKKELYDQIQEWNEDLAWYKSAQRDFWIGIYIPNIFDQFEFIELASR